MITKGKRKNLIEMVRRTYWKNAPIMVMDANGFVWNTTYKSTNK